jgi:hypothetical protein
MDLAGQRVGRKFVGFGYWEGTIVGAGEKHCTVKWENDDSEDAYTHAEAKRMLLPEPGTATEAAPDEVDAPLAAAPAVPAAAVPAAVPAAVLPQKRATPPAASQPAAEQEPPAKKKAKQEPPAAPQPVAKPDSSRKAKQAERSSEDSQRGAGTWTKLPREDETRHMMHFFLAQLRWEYGRILSGLPDPITEAAVGVRRSAERKAADHAEEEADTAKAAAFAAFDAQLAVIDPAHDHTDLTGPGMSALMRAFFDRHAKGDKWVPFHPVLGTHERYVHAGMPPRGKNASYQLME